MRIVETLLTPRYRIVIYTLENHWYIEFEAGPMKQGYKFSKEKHPSLEAAKLLLSDAFLDAVYNQFNTMFGSMKNADGGAAAGI